MSPIQRYIEETVQSNTRKLMAGDAAIPAKTAVAIAMQAASMAIQAGARATSQVKRIELTCHVVGPMLNQRLADPSNLGEIKASCSVALVAVDTVFDLVSTHPESTIVTNPPNEEETEAQEENQQEDQTH